MEYFALSFGEHRTISKIILASAQGGIVGAAIVELSAFLCVEKKRKSICVMSKGAGKQAQSTLSLKFVHINTHACRHQTYNIALAGKA